MKVKLASGLTWNTITKQSADWCHLVEASCASGHKKDYVKLL